MVVNEGGYAGISQMYESSKMGTRLNVWGSVSPTLDALALTFQGHDLPIENWWEGYISSVNVTNRQHSILDERGIEAAIRWLYSGHKKDLMILHQSFCEALERLRAKRAALAQEKPYPIQRRPQMLAEAGVVYLLKAAERYKIGRTKELERRLMEHGTSSPFPIALILSETVDNCEEVERELHQMFGSKRVKGEWFELGDNDLVIIKEYLGVRRVRETLATP